VLCSDVVELERLRLGTKWCIALGTSVCVLRLYPLDAQVSDPGCYSPTVHPLRHEDCDTVDVLFDGSREGGGTLSGFAEPSTIFDASSALPSNVSSDEICVIFSDKLSQRVRAFSESSGTVGGGTRGPKFLG